jgi:hypothetical protein
LRNGLTDVESVVILSSGPTNVQHTGRSAGGRVPDVTTSSRLQGRRGSGLD